METSKYSHTLLQEGAIFSGLASIASNGHREFGQISLKATSVGILEALVNITAAHRQDILWHFLQTHCGAELIHRGLGIKSKCSSWDVSPAQKVLSSRQWHPQPVGHTSWVRNHSIIWLVWPPCPHVRQKLEEPRTAT